MVTEQMWGISYDKPVRRMREYLDGLLPLLAGQPAEAVGETVTTRGSLQIPGAPTPDVYIAALGPQMLRLAGRRTAGTLTWMTGPKTLAEHVGPTLREAAAEAGRPGDRGAGRCLAAGERHRRRRGRARQGCRGVRDLRAAAVLPRDARPRGVLRTRGRRDHRRRERRCPSASTNWPRRVSTSSPPSPSTRPLRGVNAPARCCARRTHNGPKFLWCDRSHRRTIERTTGSGVTSPKCRQRG